MNNGMQHLHARKRLYKYLEPFPSTNSFKRALDYLMYGVGIVQPIALVPQIVSVYYHGQTSGISISTWLLLAFFNALWATYGFVHRDKAILIANFLMMSGDLAVVIGVLTH
jgi:uncharacterized protein with PQ loop repeat